MSRPHFRLLVTGSRRWPANQAEMIGNAIGEEIAWSLRPAGGLVVVDHGDCHLGGADHYAEMYVQALRARGQRWISSDPLPADTKVFGDWPACGPKRNAALVARRPNRVLAFPTPGSKGTWDCAHRAYSARIPVRVIRPAGYLPVRVQRSRASGSRTPRSALYVGRGTQWGNPYNVEAAPSHHPDPHQWAVDRFTLRLASQPELVAQARLRLQGWDLACWCAPGKRCHADVLLAIVNGGELPVLAAAG